MTKIPASVQSVPVLILHVLVVPLFFLSFVLLYESAWMDRFLGMGKDSITLVFNVLMLFCILIGVLCASRIPMTVLRHRMRLTWFPYIFWCFGEIVVFSFFAALFMALRYGDYGYFPALGHCMLIAISTLSYPYLIINGITSATHPDKDEVAEEDLVRFTDTTGRLKLVIAHDVILYVEAQENYISIHYLEGEQRKEYSLRQSMRGIEDLMARHGIIRCQRSYFVNPRHVTVLRRDKEGFIQAELDVTNSKPVPVSPKYYEQLSKML